MTWQTIQLKENEPLIRIILNRLEKSNSINKTLLMEINEALNAAERNPRCRIVVLEGQSGIFCSGMDFQEVALGQDKTQTQNWTELYMATLKRITLFPKVVACKIDGQVIAGGTGFVAACDWAITTTNTQIKLSEALWGLIPAMVVPYLIRRIGWQQAYTLALTCRGISAQEAHDIHLVDEVTDDLEEAITQLTRRIGRIKESSVVELKEYFARFSGINSEMEYNAVAVINRLMAKPQVQADIRNFVERGQLPWEHK